MPIPDLGFDFEESTLVVGRFDYPRDEEGKIIQSIWHRGWSKPMHQWMQKAVTGPVLGWGKNLCGWSLRYDGPLQGDNAWAPHDPNVIMGLTVKLLGELGYEKVRWSIWDTGALVHGVDPEGNFSSEIIKGEGPARLAALQCLTEAGKMAEVYLEKWLKAENKKGNKK
jgi:hypothetical protein